MTKKLFRDEALVGRQHRRLGTIYLQPPQAGWVFFWLAVLVIVSLLCMLILGSYTRRETVGGLVVPNRGMLSVRTSAPGTVLRSLVTEGQRVSKGQPIVELTGEQTSVALGDTRESVSELLQLKGRKLESDLVEHASSVVSRRRDLQSQIALLRGQSSQLEEQIVLQQQRADGAMNLYKLWAEQGEGGVVSRVQLLQQHDIALQNSARVKELRQQELDLSRQARALQGELGQLSFEALDQNSQTQRELADVRQALSQNEVLRAVRLRSPAEGVVTNLLAHPGQSVTSGQSLVTLLPTNSKLQVQLWVPSRAVGFVNVGDAVVLRYDAFPYQRYGQKSGRVREVSQSAVMPDDLNKLLGRNFNEPRYQVIVALDDQTMFVEGKTVPLKPGMTLSADVLLERRRLYEWLLVPVQGFIRNAHVGERAPKETRR